MRMIMNNKWQIEKDEKRKNLKILFQNFSGRFDENHDYPVQD
jgi:hypothetical protein